MSGHQTNFDNVVITLEHDIDEQYQYQPAEIIRGKIGIHLQRSTLVRSVFISVKGEGLCSWEDEYGDGYQSSEIYVDATQLVVDAEDKPRYLDHGFHDFPFEYQLPENIPSSFIGKFGSITYILKATIKGERTGDTTIATEPFLVMRKTTLPEKTHEPSDFKLAKTFFSTCSWGKVMADISVNKTGFVPGEDILLDAEIQNRSPLRITAIQASLMMNTLYRAQKNQIPFRQIVNKRRDDYELTEGDGRRWQNVRVSIPPYIPESNLACCDIIELTYSFQFRIELSGGKEMRIEHPILIGANTLGLEVPADFDDQVNKHWTMGPKGFAKAKLDEMENPPNAWKLASPEFRTDVAVNNPLYTDAHQQANGDHHDHRKNSKKKKDGKERKLSFTKL